MTDSNPNTQAEQQAPTPNPDLKSLDRLVGTWEVSGGAQGRVTYEWMEGGFFLLQRVDLEQYGMKLKGIEIIGHEQPFGAEPGEEIKSRYYDTMGNTLDYVYELEGDTRSSFGVVRRVLRPITRVHLTPTAIPLPVTGCIQTAAGTPRP
jgi:hypothetical protein